MTTTLRHALLCLLLPLCCLAAEAEAPRLSLLSPDTALSAAGAWSVELVAFNPGQTTLSYQPPARLAAQATIGGRRVPVEFLAGQTSRMVIAPGGFASRRYVAATPSPGRGLVVLEFGPGLPQVLRTALLVEDQLAPGTDHAQVERPMTNLARAVPAASVIQRTLADRLAPHEPIYFVYGPDAPAAKFQFSFKYRLHDLPGLARLNWTRSLQLGFTQRSLWDIDGPSSPFYDTSYMPEVIFESLTPMPERSDHRFTWLGYQAAFKHESNGRDGPGSRSLNTVSFRSAFVFGALDGWHLLVAPEVFTYVSSLEDNTDLKDYRGYGQLRLALGRNDGPSLMAAIWAGRKLDHASIQLDLTFPIRTKLLNFETYLLVQYFNGYGESLLSYRDQTETVRAGISLVR
jgi:phospholipase A1